MARSLSRNFRCTSFNGPREGCEIWPAYDATKPAPELLETVVLAASLRGSAVAEAAVDPLSGPAVVAAAVAEVVERVPEGTCSVYQVLNERKNR